MKISRLHGGFVVARKKNSPPEFLRGGPWAYLRIIQQASMAYCWFWFWPTGCPVLGSKI